MRFRCVHADAENHGVHGLVLSQVGLEIVRLESAAAGEVFRVEVEHDPLAAKILQARLLALVRG